MDVSKGMYWIGQPGTLWPLKDYVGQLDIEDDEDLRVTPILGGGRQVAVSRTRPPRTWQVTIPGAHVEDVRNIRTLLAATMPPYSWVDPWAQVTNVLTPEQSILNSSTPQLAFGGGYPIAAASGGGWAVTSRVNPAAANGGTGLVLIGPAPIPPGWSYRQVTVSAYLGTARANGAYVFVRWLNAAGVQVGSDVIGNYVTGMDGLRRSVVTATPAWGAVTCRVGIYYAEVISMPAVTWTDEATAWDVGNGATQVVAHNPKRSIEYAVGGADDSLRRQDYSFTVTEFGP